MSGGRWIPNDKLDALRAAGRLREVTRIGKPLPGPHWDDNIEPAQIAAPFLVPWPPSGNTAVRHANGAHYLRPEVLSYRQTVAMLAEGLPKIAGPYTLHYHMSPPDARRRDADNAIKSLNDALVICGYLQDDSLACMRELRVTVDDQRDGSIRIIAAELTMPGAA